MSLHDTECRLMSASEDARKQAYAPYSSFTVGAALLADDGEIYSGCNIENASYGATLCAERTAFAKAILEGKRSFSMIAICGGQKHEAARPCPPCGMCRQVMSEFCDPDFTILLVDQTDPEKSVKTTLGELFPAAFDKTAF